MKKLARPNHVVYDDTGTLLATCQSQYHKGNLFPSWKGNAIITGLSAQGIVRATITGETARKAQRISMGKRMRGIRQDRDGAVWVIEDGAGGRLLKLTPN
jgi:glucose/arabinose dehydrogenase